MVEDGSAPPPQIFVVDSQASHISMPRVNKSLSARAGQKLLCFFLVLCLLGVFIEGYLIYRLYQRTENGKTSSQKGIQATESNEIPKEIPPRQPEKRPLAHLLGAENPIGGDDVVQWNSRAEQDILNMGYNNSRLIIQHEGFYYVYSKVEIDVSQETKPIFHKVMKNSSGYGKPIELLKSKSNCCLHKSSDNSQVEDIRSSFLAGIFHLQDQDQIFVTLSKLDKLYPGANQNSFGAFLIQKSQH